MYSILTLNKISPKGLSRLPAEKFTCSDSAATPDAVIVRSASMHDTEFASNLLAIARAGAGVNNIPVDRCTENGICVFNTPGANANAVKELVICGLFLASRKIAAGAQWCLTLKDSDEVSKKVEKGKSAFAGPEILGKTLGIIGLGAIGILVANAAKALGMNVIGYDPFISDAAKARLTDGITVTADLDEIFVESDYITVHAPLTDSTRGVINASSLSKAKDGVRILNFARGELVAENDIIEALQSGKAAAYVTDFPTAAQIGVDGVTALPHLGASTPEAEENCAIMAAEQLADYLINGNVKNSVNFPSVLSERCGKIRLTAVSRTDAAGNIERALSNSGVDVKNTASGEKKGVYYSIFDVDDDITDETVEALKSTDGIISIRII
ncbi:MAG: 3-phosphoglycerate dehydrogenase family protein [Oscillospiraceae bacterium]|nr:3-phosphoglycerate dehydrogenase family protein [Oscillospiraceae bacterium]